MARSILGNKARQQSGNQGEQLIQFRHRDAQRVANVVAAHEARRRDRKPSSLPRAAGGAGGAGGVLRAQFSGSWFKGATKVVVIQGEQTATAQCNNYIVDILYSDTERTCFIVPHENPDYTLLIPECIR
jgi:hypothetical protein